MKKSYRRITVAALLTALAALGGCEGAVSMQQGGPNINSTTPEPLTPLPLPELVPEVEASFLENLLG